MMGEKWYGRRAASVLVVGTLAIGLEAAGPGAGRTNEFGQQSLQNSRVAVELGPRGIVALTDRASGRVYEIRDDGFTITLDGQAFSSASLPDPARAAGPDQVAYTWTLEPYRINVEYELQPDWGFLSKRVSVTVAPGARFRVDTVEPVRLQLAERPTEVYVQSFDRPSLQTGDYGGAIRFADGTGLLLVVQNPFLDVVAEETSVSIGYEPDMEWTPEWGSFASDRALIAPYVSTGRRLPRQMLPEWRMGSRDATDGMDEAEIAAFTEMVRAFLIAPHERPLNIFVGWTANDYQIDVGTSEGRTEYRRLLNRAAQLGAEYVLYAPSNSLLSRREESVDDWSWEHVLWLGLGQQIRRGEWDPAADEIPWSVREMVGYARSRNLRLLAYVYPIMPFAVNPEWHVARPGSSERRYADLGIRSLQDWLIQRLVAFYERAEIGGFAFDHTFLVFDGTSRYAQWFGWRRVMEELRRRIPDVVIDGRQAYHLYGPWSWLAGSYPHPTYSDEQPESFVPFPDLHFDRVSANRQRFTAYRFRNRDFAPSEIMPGFIGHQTSRSDDTGRMPSMETEDRGVVLERIRARDWDYLGWRYSLLSSIATAGWNNVLNMIPARDLEEFRHFSPADADWLRRWLDWTEENGEYLRNTRTILGQPALGAVDGTAAMRADGGYVFLFNPNGRVQDTEIRLDDSIGLDGDGPWLVQEIYPVGGRAIGKPGTGLWATGDRVPLELDGGSAKVYEIRRASGSRSTPRLFGVTGSVVLRGDAVSIERARDEPGVQREMLVLLPPGTDVTTLRVNGQAVPYERPSRDVLTAVVHFAGSRFRQYQQVGQYDRTFDGGGWAGTFSIPGRVFDQLDARREAWPLSWTAEDSLATWLVPERLLLFIQIAEPADSMEVRMRIDGEPVALTRAYSAVRVVPRTFVGFYADVSHLEPDRRYRVELDLPPLRPGQFQGLFFENVEAEYTARLGEARPLPASAGDAEHEPGP